MEEEINFYINESINVKRDFLNSIDNNNNNLSLVINELISCIKSSNKIMICGNGGSAADSQHFAAELVGRYKLDREPMAAIALTTDTSIISSIANDYSYDEIFSKQVEAIGKESDILIGISTSGNSKNIFRAFEVAQKKGILCIGLLGKRGGIIENISDKVIIVPSDNTARIQECHIMIVHIICEIIEKRLFGKNYS